MGGGVMSKTLEHKISEWNPAEEIDSSELALAYLEEVIKENDPELFLEALGEVARSKGMTEIARNTGLDRAGLYKAFSGTGNPSFDTVVKVLSQIGLYFRLSARRTA
jgi:probable addiction module antidote protein